MFASLEYRRIVFQGKLLPLVMYVCVCVCVCVSSRAECEKIQSRMRALQFMLLAKNFFKAPPHVVGETEEKTTKN